MYKGSEEDTRVIGGYEGFEGCIKGQRKGVKRVRGGYTGSEDGCTKGSEKVIKGQRGYKVGIKDQRRV